MCSHRNCVLNVTFQSESTFHLAVYKTDSLHSIKQQLAQHTGIPVAYQILSYSGYAMLDDAASIEQLTESNSTPIVAICLDIAVSGGASNILPFSAPDMCSNECFEIRSFSTSDTHTLPSYRTISKGLNFEAFCRTPTCVALDKRVAIQFGMRISELGMCNYAEVMFELPCPVCKQHIDPNDITNVHFMDCAVGVKCRIYQASAASEYSMVAPANQYLALKEPERMLQYHFIKFSLK